MIKPADIIVRLQNRPKIFCIGFNKTGTTSLHKYFRSAGLRSLHNTDWPKWSAMQSGWIYFNKSQCFSDGEKSDFVNLNRWFPQAIFVLNTRDERKWLISRVKHVMRYNETPPKPGLMERSDFGVMAKEFFFNREAAIWKWALERRIYEDQVRTYFSGKSCFLELDLTTGPDWMQNLSNHLTLREVAHTPVVQQIHSNKRDQKDLIDQAQLAQCVEIVDRFLVSAT